MLFCIRDEYGALQLFLDCSSYQPQVARPVVVEEVEVHQYLEVSTMSTPVLDCKPLKGMEILIHPHLTSL